MATAEQRREIYETMGGLNHSRRKKPVAVSRPVFGSAFDHRLSVSSSSNALKPTGMSALLSPKLPTMVVRCIADILVGLRFTNAPKPTGMSALLSPKLPVRRAEFHDALIRLY